jgi:hypothetical protein
MQRPGVESTDFIGSVQDLQESSPPEEHVVQSVWHSTQVYEAVV